MGLTEGESLGSMLRFIEMRKDINDHKFYYIFNNDHQFYNNYYQAWFGFIAGTQERTKVITQEEFPEIAFKRPFAVFMFNDNWLYLRNQILQKYPYIKIRRLTEEGLMAIELRSFEKE